jgi:hypothetical protein
MGFFSYFVAGNGGGDKAHSASSEKEGWQKIQLEK